MSKTVIGRWVFIDLPDIDIKSVKAKVDTGAYRCSLHCDYIEEYEANGETYLSIIITDLGGQPMIDHAVQVPKAGVARVRSSNGEQQERPMIVVPVHIAGEVVNAEFTLTNRQDMRFPILLGRKFLRENFIVDVSLDDPTEEE